MKLFLTDNKKPTNLAIAAIVLTAGAAIMLAMKPAANDTDTPERIAA
jgi:hypothetical protein